VLVSDGQWPYSPGIKPTIRGDDELGWLNDLVLVPRNLVVGFGLPACMTRARYLSWIAVELAVAGETFSVETSRVLDRLSIGIVDGRDAGLMSDSGTEVIVAAAVGAIPDPELLVVASELGFGHSRIDCSIDGVARALRAVMVKKLTFAIRKLHRRSSRRLDTAQEDRTSLRRLVHSAPA
jgi:hypothetical protein